MIFFKYQGTGNDFVLLDGITNKISLSATEIANLCHRRFGIGADGLIIFERTEDADFKMVYFNSDGRESTMCGNGGRCAVAFAHRLGIIKNKTVFRAIDGLHTATITQEKSDGILMIDLMMNDVSTIIFENNVAILNTGSPHYVYMVDDVDIVDVVKRGREIRYSHLFGKEGINVNFVQKIENGIIVRTYERGVEDETMSCGTGVTASAIASIGNATGQFLIKVKTPGGELTVSFIKDSIQSAKKVILAGPATFVYKGEIEIK